MTKRHKLDQGGDSIGVAEVLMLLSKGDQEEEVIMRRAMNISGRVFGCKTCNRQFPTFQALGGHRASHKKAKVQSSEEEDDDRNEKMRKPPLPKAKVHGCSICGIEFAIGQALGGHMRRHRSVVSSAEEFGHYNGFVEKNSSNGKRVLLDLNLPPLDFLC